MKYHIFYIIICNVLMLITQRVIAVEKIQQTTHFQKIVKTAKERLGKKASEEQRVNHCKSKEGQNRGQINVIERTLIMLSSRLLNDCLL